MRVSTAGKLLFLVLPMVSYGSPAREREGLIRRLDIPNSGRDWVSLPNGVEFQPALDKNRDSSVKTAMNTARGRFLGSSYENEFVDGTETYYDPYSQAWRLLGFYIDCSQQQQAEERRKLEENEDEDAVCTRMLLWAAYVDLEYEGGGIGEYQYWDRSKKKWNTEPCKKSGSSRCAKMDCHDKNTHFKLLGLFKEPDFGDWMGQLFKHSGVCLWTEDEYEFMQDKSEEWPEECTQTGTSDENGNYLYYDTKPMSQGRISIGLYTDSSCAQDYTGKMKVEDVLYSAYYGDDDGNDNDDDGSMLALENNIDAFNDAFNVFKFCQPCIAYNLNYDGDGEGDDDGEGDENGDGEGNGLFDCYDDAGYVNVNQCMKFSTQTNMYTAEYQDVVLASEQGSIVGVSMMGKSYGYGKSSRRRIAGNIFLVFSILVFCLGVFMFWKANKRARATSLDTPLVSKAGGVAT